LQDRSCQVWWAGRAVAHDGLLDLLSPVELGRRAAYLRPADRDRFVIGAVLIRMLAAAHTSIDPRAVDVRRRCPRCVVAHGRPTLPDTTLQVSVSHSGDVVVVACGRVEAVGVDVELVDESVDTRAVVDHALSAGEAQNVDGARDFSTYWTRKEAVLKCTGDGLTVPLGDVVVTAPAERPALLTFAGRDELPARLELCDLTPPQGYVAALAVVPRAAAAITEHDANRMLTSVSRA
jgi:4'-phosphopantetheinyl transferase